MTTDTYPRKRLTTKEPSLTAPNDVFIAWLKENTKDGEQDCWEWKGAYNRWTGVPVYKNTSALTYAYKRINGLLDVDTKTFGRVAHTCDNKKCVNPAHARVEVGKYTMLHRAVQSTGSGERVDTTDRTLDKATMDKATMDKLAKDITERVVSELLRIKFDVLIAEAVAEEIKRK